MNINQVWPEWNEDCVLGEGSFGKVYRAKRVEFGRTFYSAIKVLTVPKNQQEIKFARSQGMNDSEIYDYFRGLVDNLLNEISLMDNLKGAQNVVGIEDYKIIERQGEIGWDIFIRMELLTPFDSFVSNPDFSQKDVVRLGLDICTALEACEQNSIVHRDIKPDNIFISRFGEYKLGDFGIARKLEATQANLSRKGTLNYMAPEVYKSEKYGSNVDIYSLGLVLYTLLNNNRIAFLPPYPQPITYKDNEEALAKRLSGVAITPPCNASASLGAVITKACAYDPKERYQTATEFKNALINEWNTLVQMGDTSTVIMGHAQPQVDLAKRLESTTNDMTVNGRLVVGQYVQETTVLNNPQTAAQPMQFYNASQDYSQFSDSMDFSFPEYYSTSKSSKLCRVLGWLMSIGLCAIAMVFVLDSDSSKTESLIGWLLLGVGSIMLITDRNKVAVGIGAGAVSLFCFSNGLVTLYEEILSDDITIESFVSLISGLLMVSGSVIIIFQREARLGGSLCLYSCIIAGFYCVYQLVNDNSIFELWYLAVCIASLSLFIWSYGYKSDERISSVKQGVHFVTYVISGILVVLATIAIVEMATVPTA